LGATRGPGDSRGRRLLWHRSLATIVAWGGSHPAELECGGQDECRSKSRGLLPSLGQGLVMPQSIRSLLRSQLERIWDKLGARIEVRRKRSFDPVGNAHRFDYQKRYLDFGIQPGMRVLDIGSGGDPFPNASVLVERYLKPVFRTESLVTNDRPLVVADIHAL